VNGIARLRRKDAVWSSIQVHRLDRRINELAGSVAEYFLTRKALSHVLPVIDVTPEAESSAIDRYWARHTVRGRAFLSRESSLKYIEELTDGRPFKRELLGLHGPHADKVILDYGCGPGNDLAGFAEFSGAREIIGVDISRKALELARRRLSWHAQNSTRVTLYRVADSNVRLPFEEASVDYIQSLGVIHHSGNPGRILAELSRVLKPNGEIRIMLYNADSVHIQLEIGFCWQIENGQIAGVSAEEAFSLTADLGAPVAHCVRPVDLEKWLTGVDLTSEFLGGYFVPGESADWQWRRAHALADDRVSGTQRRFLENLIPGVGGLPFCNGKSAGLGGVYVLRKVQHRVPS
jgi:SAM-dependent methyltransferase